LCILVLADPASISAKAKEARAFGLRIIGEDELQGMLQR